MHSGVCDTPLQVLFGFNRVCGILVGVLPALYGDRYHGDGGYEEEGDEENPGSYGCAFGEAFQPMLSYPPAEGSRYDEASYQYIKVPAVEHPEDFACGASEYLADAYLLAAVFALEHGQAEYADDADDDSKQGEEQDLLGESQLVAVCIVEHLVHKTEMEVVSRREFSHCLLQRTDDFYLVCSGGDADVDGVFPTFPT